MTEPYPKTWPRPIKTKPKSLQTRITEQQKLDLYNRVITTRDLAKQLDVHERYLSYSFPRKVPVINKKPLIEARKAFKLEMGKQVLSGKYTVTQAAEVANVAYNTMRRFVEKARLVMQGPETSTATPQDLVTQPENSTTAPENLVTQPVSEGQPTTHNNTQPYPT